MFRSPRMCWMLVTNHERLVHYEVQKVLYVQTQPKVWAVRKKQNAWHLTAVWHDNDQLTLRAHNFFFVENKLRNCMKFVPFLWFF